MQISEIRVKLVGNRTDRLKAFCSVTFDNSFVVRDLKIIEGANSYFVAMPSRKITDHCPSCGSKNHLRARFCSDCGAKLDETRADRASAGRTKLHADVAHPINSQSREYIQSAIVEAYEKEVELSQQPDYQPQNLDIDDYDITGHATPTSPPPPPPPPASEQPPETPATPPTTTNPGRPSARHQPQTTPHRLRPRHHLANQPPLFS